jgi:hypothetical protein
MMISFTAILVTFNGAGIVFPRMFLSLLLKNASIKHPPHVVFAQQPIFWPEKEVYSQPCE